MNPEVSVLLAVYNGASFLKNAIDSVLNQSYTDFELIIVNDGSEDTSEEEVLAFSDQRIKYFFKPHEGLPQTLNFGLKQCRGKYLARIDADDMWISNKLEFQIGFLNRNNGYSFIASNRIYIDSQDKVIKEGEPKLNLIHSEMIDLLACYNFICHSSIVLRMEAINKVNLYSIKTKYCEDYELWYRILKEHNGSYSSRSLVLYRVHAKMLSLTQSRKMAICILKVKLKIFFHIKFKFKYLKYFLIDILRIINPKKYTEFVKMLENK